MSQINNFSCYMDVKIPSRAKRGFKLWKAWKKHWCEIKRLDSIEYGMELKLKSSKDANTILNSFLVPRSALISRTVSRTKQYAFGVFNLGLKQKPVIYLNGGSENQTQEWMSVIRKMLSIAAYIPVDNNNFRVSLVDNHHSRQAGLVGTFGVLSINHEGLVIRDSCTGEPKVTWRWFQFHQFHLQIPLQLEDEHKVIVMHTSSEFPSGPGQLILYCEQAARLLYHLVGRGQAPKSNNRLSRSEGDLYNSFSQNENFIESPVCLRSQTGSEDSGIRESIGSEEMKSLEDGFGLLDVIVKTPGGSEDSVQDLLDVDIKLGMTRNESGISLVSGIYEEIPEDVDILPETTKKDHVYENPLEVKKTFVPPPLPPRSSGFTLLRKIRSNTMPTQDYSRLSKIFTSESDYEVMTPTKTTNDNFCMPVRIEKPKNGINENLIYNEIEKCRNDIINDSKSGISENFYMPMLPLKFKTESNVIVDLKND